MGALAAAGKGLQSGDGGCGSLSDATDLTAARPEMIQPAYARIGTTLPAIGVDVSRSASAVPAVTTTAGMKTNTKETTVNAPTTESSVETTRMEVVMMEKT